MNDLAAAMATVGDQTGAIIEAAQGYREKCKAAGFPDEDASRMAVDYHALLLNAFGAAVAAKTGGRR